MQTDGKETTAVLQGPQRKELRAWGLRFVRSEGCAGDL